MSDPWRCSTNLSAPLSTNLHCWSGALVLIPLVSVKIDLSGNGSIFAPYPLWQHSERTALTTSTSPLPNSLHNRHSFIRLFNEQIHLKLYLRQFAWTLISFMLYFPRQLFLLFLNILPHIKSCLKSLLD